MQDLRLGVCIKARCVCTCRTPSAGPWSLSPPVRDGDYRNLRRVMKGRAAVTPGASSLDIYHENSTV